MHLLENNDWIIGIHTRGAELMRIYNKISNTEYLWKGDPAFWGKHSPVLFPIVGTLKNNSFQYQGRTYQMGRHGFARDRVFEIETETVDAICFKLTSDDETLAIYPFHFELRIRYTLAFSTLKVQYEVRNTGHEKMYFSIGGHPAFAIPLENNIGYEDYYLEFEQPETIDRWPISSDSLIENDPIPFMENQQRVPLNRELFYRDALVFKGIRSRWVTLQSDKGSKGLRFTFEGFPFLGIWAARDADFVCIEPWCGIADNVNSDQQLAGKEGILSIEKGAEWARSWEVRFF
ncbi:MAG: aldose 1-epimerase family protein [Terrimonas sp.]|nr:aldose 1-epimerase family protein [Terrimonas sp.]